MTLSHPPNSAKPAPSDHRQPNAYTDPQRNSTTRFAATIMPAPAPITSKSNARVKSLRASFSGKPSHPGDLLGLEGEHLIAEAIRSGLTVETLFLREGSEDALSRPALAGLRTQSTLILSRDVFVSAVETASPQGIAATVLIPTIPPPPPQPQSLTLILESLQDPGNLGTLIRSAEAFRAHQIFLTPDTVHPWNPKAVRASAGSVFRLPITRAPLAQIAAQLRQQGTVLYAAVAQLNDALSLLETTFAPHTAILIGNEGAGLSAEAQALSNHRIRIPCAVESLNAAIAGSTLLYEALRQRTASQSLIPNP